MSVPPPSLGLIPKVIPASPATPMETTRSVGGFGGHVLHLLANAGALDRGLKVRAMTLPDVFVEHDTPTIQYEKIGLNASGIVANVLAALGVERAAASA